MRELLQLDCPLAPRQEGHHFKTSWPVRVADVGASGVVGLEAIGRYMQDVGFDHLVDTDVFDTHPHWIIRRAVVDYYAPLQFPELLHFERWCDAYSTRWCDMRMTTRSSGGGHVESVSFAIHMNATTMMPSLLSDRFQGALDSSARTNRLRWQASLSAELPDLSEPNVERHRFPLRLNDLDHMGHVNNAAYWQGVEHALGAHAEFRAHRSVIEYVSPIMSTDEVYIRIRRAPGVTYLWFEVDGVAKTLVSVSDL